MAIFFDTEDKLEIEQVHEIQKSIGVIFPESYVEHLLKFNGGRCEPNGFSFDENGKLSDSSIDWFLAIYDGEYDNFLEYYRDYKIEEKRMPESIFPIAHDPGVNLICLDSIDGKVYFWDHENEVDYNISSDSDISNLYLIENSFDEFIASLH